MKIEKFVKKSSGMYKLFLDNDEVIELHEDLILKEDLLLKIALCNLTLRTTGCKPILLLDDVFSELDDVRCRSLIAFLSGENQTFITTTNVENIPTYLKERAYIINLKEWIKWQI